MHPPRIGILNGLWGDVRVGKMRFVVAAFAGCLHAAEKEELHGGMVSLVFQFARWFSSFLSVLTR